MFICAFPAHSYSLLFLIICTYQENSGLITYVNLYMTLNHYQYCWILCLAWAQFPSLQQYYIFYSSARFFHFYSHASISYTPVIIYFHSLSPFISILVCYSNFGLPFFLFNNLIADFMMSLTVLHSTYPYLINFLEHSYCV